jgi:hypothetical protein
MDPLFESKQIQAQKDGFPHLVHNLFSHLCTQKIPYPKPSGKQVLKIPNNRDQWLNNSQKTIKNLIPANYRTLKFPTLTNGNLRFS